MFGKNVSHLQDTVENYGIGEFHPCYVGEILNDRYVVFKKIAMTQYSSVWAAKDLAFDIYVTIKVFKSAPIYNEIALEEVEKIQLLRKKSKQSDWAHRLAKHNTLLDLKDKLSEQETFCVRFSHQVLQLVHSLRSFGQPLLHSLRVPWPFVGGTVARRRTGSRRLISFPQTSSKESLNKCSWGWSSCTSTAASSTPT